MDEHECEEHDDQADRTRFEEQQRDRREADVAIGERVRDGEAHGGHRETRRLEARDPGESVREHGEARQPRNPDECVSPQ